MKGLQGEQLKVATQVLCRATMCVVLDSNPESGGESHRQIQRLRLRLRQEDYLQIQANLRYTAHRSGISSSRDTVQVPVPGLSHVGTAPFP